MRPCASTCLIVSVTAVAGTAAPYCKAAAIARATSSREGNGPSAVVNEHNVRASVGLRLQPVAHALLSGRAARGRRRQRGRGFRREAGQRQLIETAIIGMDDHRRGAVFVRRDQRLQGMADEGPSRAIEILLGNRAAEPRASPRGDDNERNARRQEPAPATMTTAREMSGPGSEIKERDPSAKPRDYAPKARAASPIMVTKTPREASSNMSRIVWIKRSDIDASFEAGMFSLCSCFDPVNGRSHALRG